MKRFYLFALLFLVSLPMSAATKNKISMITYFPVPYVAYSRINANQMDIGLTSTCDMKLGCDVASEPLKAESVNLYSGRLNLDGGLGMVGNSLGLGNGAGVGKIQFNNVRIQTGNMESVNAQNISVNTLNLFGKKFPSCKNANVSGNGQMKWKRLKLDGASEEELYLMCGGEDAASADPKPDTPTCSDRSYKLAHKNICCPESAKTDTDCYSEILEWTFVQGGIVEGGDDCPRFQAGASKECSQKGEICELETTCQHVGDRGAERCFSSRYECAFKGAYKQLW